VLTLKSKGIEDAAALLGGMAAWKNAGLPTEGSAVK
jgi:rhodanese-related sulfurtransferase